MAKSKPKVPLAPLTQRIKEQALAEGFVAVGICRPDAIPEAAGRLAAFVEADWHGQMGWMAERMGWRGDPTALWPEARSVIMLAEAYVPPENPLHQLKNRDQGIISAYAQGKDYHDLVKRRLKRLGRWLVDAEGGEIKVFVDTAPVMEKPLAQAAGLGWQGKHTNLLSRDFGNWVFLGAIFTTHELEVDAPEVSHCGRCTACIDICPTKAIVAPYQMEARRCISYLTIEHKGPIPQDLRPALGNRIYGCDDCLAICPWNKFAIDARDMGYQHRHGQPPLAELAALDDAAFRERFAGSPIKRVGRNSFVRNVLYAIGNSDSPQLAPVAQQLIGDPDDTVAEAATWALARLEDAHKNP